MEIPEFKEKEKQRSIINEVDEAYNRFISDGVQKRL